MMFVCISFFVSFFQNECDAVWAGWGHASENPALPNALEAVKSRKIVFIGPPAGVLCSHSLSCPVSRVFLPLSGQSFNDPTFFISV